MTADPDVFLSFKSVKKTYDRRSLVVRDFSLDVRRGEFVTLLGPSGSGKTTVLMMLAGFEHVTSGDIVIDGASVTRTAPYERNIGMVFQNYALFPHMTVAENLAYPLKVRKLPRNEIRKRVEQYLKLVELEDFGNRHPAQLSGGQRQRVALARALIFEPALVLMDEPLSALDKKLREQMQFEISRLHRQLGCTVVYVTHDQAEAMSMADQVVLLNRGQLVQVASAPQMYAEPATTFAARFIGTPPMNLLALEGNDIAGSNITLPLPAAAAWLGVRPEAIRLARPGEANSLPATVAGTEYLGADRVIRCTVGTQQHLLVRADGRVAVEPGQPVGLYWDVGDTHAFDADERRLSLHVAA